MENIREMELWQGAQLNQAKVILADEATTMLHGKECLESIHKTAQSLFSSGGGSDLNSLDKIPLTVDQLQLLGNSQFSVVDLLIHAKLATSKNEGKKAIRNGAIRINDAKIIDEANLVQSKDFDTDGRMKLSFGKKTHVLITIN